MNTSFFNTARGTVESALYSRSREYKILINGHFVFGVANNTVKSILKYNVEVFNCK